MNIRHPTINDLDQCCIVESTCFTPAEAATRVTIRKRIVQYQQGYLIAELDHQIIAHINSASTNKNDITDEAFKNLIGHDPTGRNIVIFSLAVIPKYRGTGIASQLMSHFIKQARNMHKQNILLLCKPDLISFYEHLGFTYRAKSSSTHGNTQWHEMFLPLSPSAIPQ